MVAFYKEVCIIYGAEHPLHILWLYNFISGLVAQLGAHAGQLYAPFFGPVAYMAPIRFASPFIKTSYHHIFGPVTRLAVNRDRYMGP